MIAKRSMSRPFMTGVALLAAVTLGVPSAFAAAKVRPGPPPSRPAPAPICQGPALTKADGSPWTCTFDDEFNGTTLDSSKWLPITTALNGAPGGGTGTNVACFTNSPNNISVANGVLSLTARKEPAPFVCKSPTGDFTSQYTSGQVASYTKFSQTYGRFAIRAKFPAATVAGLQSALWMWPENNFATGLTGEIDIAEEYSQYADRAIPTLHYTLDPTSISAQTSTNMYTSYSCLISDVSAFHEYAVEWTPSSFTVLYDGQTCLVDNYKATGTSPFDQPYFIALSQYLGIGTNAFDPLNTPLPATTQIDWVRAWK